MNNDEFNDVTDEEKLDIFMNLLRENKRNSKYQVLDPKRFGEMESAYNTLSKMVIQISPDAKITACMHEINDGVGVIRIETDEIIVANINEFVKAIRNADNFEIFPLKNGNIKIGIVFYGVMKIF